MGGGALNPEGGADLITQDRAGNVSAVGAHVMLPLVSGGLPNTAPIGRTTADKGRGILGCYPLRGKILRSGVEQPGIENPHEDALSSLSYIPG